MNDESSDCWRWPAAHMLHDAAVLMADVLAEPIEYGTDRAALVAAIEAFEAARDGDGN
jgi:hypothetical protein